jgi:hypothetical protein
LEQLGAIKGRMLCFPQSLLFLKRILGSGELYLISIALISINKIHFKMEGLPDIRDLLRKGDWIFSVDIKDAYHHLGIHMMHQKYFCFADCDGLTWCYCCLPFGLTSAPRLFTKVV